MISSICVDRNDASHGSVSAEVDRRRYLGGMVTFLPISGRGSSPVDMSAALGAVC